MYEKKNKSRNDFVFSSSRAKNLSLRSSLGRSICNILQIRLGKKPRIEPLNEL